MLAAIKNNERYKMQRHKDLVMEIATALRDSESNTMSVTGIEAALGDDAMPSHTVEYLVQLIRDHDLVHGANPEVRLTWAGHDYLEANTKKAPMRISADAIKKLS
jgi:hypothetical protein